MKIGNKIKFKVPDSYKYGKHAGLEMIGKITKENKKTFEITTLLKDGFLCVRINKITKEISF